MRNLSKSKILSSRQCAKKLWLEIHSKELAVDSGRSQKNFDVGNAVGDLSRAIYDPLNEGTLIDPFVDGFRAAFANTQDLIKEDKPIFEAAFSMEGGLVLADVLVKSAPESAWRMVEIKSSTSVKDYHLDDVAVQNFVTTESGLDLDSISLGHIDNKWIYQGDDDYTGLIKEVDLTEHANKMADEVKGWFDQAHSVADSPSEPEIAIGAQCTSPFDCQFLEYCSKDQPKAKYPVNWLPRIQKKVLKAFIKDNNIIEMADVPDDLLNESQLRVKEHTLADSIYFDHAESKRVLSQYQYPHYFLDFETINLAIPKWKGTRAYQQIPFQFSLHLIEDESEDVIHREFLDLSGDDPSIPFAKALIDTCDDMGPIFVYNIGFESARIKELAARFPEFSDGLFTVNDRLVDLWPVAKKYFYHPSQQGSWSIKKVLPAMSEKYNYDELDGVKDGGMAMDAFAKAIHADTSTDEKKQIEQELLKYCEMDTMAMVEIFNYLSRD